MSWEKQIEFTSAEFAENPEPRCQCLLLLDTSGSMSGKPISELNDGLITLKNEIERDALAAKRIEIAIITFGPVRQEIEFCTVDNYVPPTLMASGDTPLGAAIEEAIMVIQQRKETCKMQGIQYYRPWLLMITDGAPTDNWTKAAELIKLGEETKSFMFFAVGVEGANFEILKRISVRDPLKLRGLEFSKLFSWLSNSLSAASHSNPGQQYLIQEPTGPKGWATVG